LDRKNQKNSNPQELDEYLSCSGMAVRISRALLGPNKSRTRPSLRLRLVRNYP